MCERISMGKGWNGRGDAMQGSGKGKGVRWGASGRENE